MNKISCDICMDLMPLVFDDVASDDSKHAVINHIQGCEKCREFYTQNKSPMMEMELDIGNVTNRIKKKLFFISLCLIFAGTLFGVAIAEGELMFYNIIILPTLGAISYIALKKKVYIILLLVIICVYHRFAIINIPTLIQGGETWYTSLVAVPLIWCGMYSALFILGIIIGFLLDFGFRKD